MRPLRTKDPLFTRMLDAGAMYFRQRWRGSAAWGDSRPHGSFTRSLSFRCANKLGQAITKGERGMRPECSGIAIFRVRASGELVTIIPNDLDWQDEAEETGSDATMGLRRTHSADFEVGERGPMVVWNLWEYPLGAQEDSLTDYNDAVLELVQDFEYRLVHDPEEP